MTVASVFANITAAAGTTAAVVTTTTTTTAAVITAAAAAAAALGDTKLQRQWLETIVHGYNLCVLYSF